MRQLAALPEVLVSEKDQISNSENMGVEALIGVGCLPDPSLQKFVEGGVLAIDEEFAELVDIGMVGSDGGREDGGLLTVDHLERGEADTGMDGAVVGELDMGEELRPFLMTRKFGQPSAKNVLGALNPEFGCSVGGGMAGAGYAMAEVSGFSEGGYGVAEESSVAITREGLRHTEPATPVGKELFGGVLSGG